MDDVEIIDRMLAFDVKENPEGRGYIAPNAMFDAIDAPTDRRAYVLQLVLKLGMFEYNTPRRGIKATYIGREVYRNGGYKKHKNKEKAAEVFGYLIKTISLLKG